MAREPQSLDRGVKSRRVDSTDIRREEVAGMIVTDCWRSQVLPVVCHESHVIRHAHLQLTIHVCFQQNPARVLIRGGASEILQGTWWGFAPLLEALEPLDYSAQRLDRRRV